MSRTWVTPGGVHPPENKHQSVTQPIGQLPIPEKLIIPLSQHIGAPATPCVEIGQQVLKGQVIAEATGMVSIPMHAPLFRHHQRHRAQAHCPRLRHARALYRNHHRWCRYLD